jgi:hypothetical protein
VDNACQLGSVCTVAQLVRALHRNRRPAGSINQVGQFLPKGSHFQPEINLSRHASFTAICNGHQLQMINFYTGLRFKHTADLQVDH